MDLVDLPDNLRADRFDVLGYLNHYETIAIFIGRRVLDENTYKAWIIGTLVRDWNAASDFVQRERWGWDPETAEWRYDPSLLQALEAMACGWSSAATRLTASYSTPPNVPGKEDVPLPPLDLDEPVRATDSVDKPNP